MAAFEKEIEYQSRTLGGKREPTAKFDPAAYSRLHEEHMKNQEKIEACIEEFYAQYSPEKTASKSDVQELVERLVKPLVRVALNPNKPLSESVGQKGPRKSDRHERLYEDGARRAEKIKQQVEEKAKEEEEALRELQRDKAGKKADPVIYRRLHEEAEARRLRAEEREDVAHAREMQELFISPRKVRSPTSVEENQIVFDRLHLDHDRKKQVRRQLREAREREEITAMEWLSVHRDAQTKTEAKAVFDRLYEERPKRYYAWDNETLDSFEDDPWIEHRAMQQSLCKLG